MPILMESEVTLCNYVLKAGMELSLSGETYSLACLLFQYIKQLLLLLNPTCFEGEHSIAQSAQSSHLHLSFFSLLFKLF